MVIDNLLAVTRTKISLENAVKETSHGIWNNIDTEIKEEDTEAIRQVKHHVNQKEPSWIFFK